MRFLSRTIVFAALSLALVEASSLDSLYRRGADSKDADCDGSSFFYRNCCTPIGGPPSRESPPPGISCPTSWHYKSEQSSCYPNNPSPPPPSCPSGHTWSEGLQCCTAPDHTTHSHQPHPSGKPTQSPPEEDCGCEDDIPPPYTPTQSSDEPCPTCETISIPNYYGHYYQKTKRNVIDQWDISSCPRPLLTCPILVYGTFNGDFECVDGTSDLNSCGGCASLGKGMDCQSIPNSDMTTCLGGECIVETCIEGFEPSYDMTSCIPA